MKRSKIPKEPNPFEEALFLQIKREGLPIPSRHFRFHKDRKWEFDFCYPALRLAFEVEGGIWRRGGGAHSSGLAILRDIEKYNTATLMGWRVFRIHTEMILIKDRQMDYGWELIQAALLANLPAGGPSIFDACPAHLK